MIENFCNKCGACCRHIEADMENKVLLWDGKQPLSEEFAQMLTETSEPNIYSCKYLDNNICVNTNKPEICLKFPSSPFVKLPDNCTYYGYIFMQKEKIKQKIRKLKEEIIHYNALITTINSKKELNQIQKIIISHQRYIDKYKNYGSSNW